MEEPLNPYAAPATLEPSADASQWQGGPSESLRQVAAGLNILRASVIVALLVSLVIVAVNRYPYFARMSQDTWRSYHIGIAWIMVVVHGIGLIGTLNCLSAPAETHPRRWVGAAALTAMLNIIVSVGPLVRFGTAGNWYTRALLSILACAATIVFLRKLAKFLGRRDLAQLAFVLLIVLAADLAVASVYSGVGAVWTVDVLQHLPAAVEWMFFRSIVGLMSLLPLVVDVLYLMLLTQLRSAILTGQSPAEARSEPQPT